jgi:very-short-patch-repair endonuclease
VKALIPNDWNRIRAFYDVFGPRILAGERWEWAIDAYAWDEWGGFNFTPIESWLWADIRNNNAIFYPQYPVASFFVDFANPLAKVAIECDGFHYHLDKEKDRARDEVLAALGWSVYRIPGHVCRTEQDEETGESSEAFRFVRDIANRHRLSRNHKPKAAPIQTGIFARCQ